MDETYRLKKMARLCDTRDKVIDIGCAHLPNPFLRAKELIGFDKEKTMLPSNYARFVQGDIHELPHPFSKNHFDAIHAGEILEHIEDSIAFLRKCLDILKPDGVIVLSTPNPNSFAERCLTLTLNRRYMYTKDHVCLFPQRWLIRMMEQAGFTHISLYSGGVQTPFGLIPFPRPWCYQTIATGYKQNAKTS